MLDKIESIAIIPSFRCNAACSYCCFQSSPNESYGMSLELIHKILEKSSRILKPKVVVFTGGEPTLDLKRLEKSILSATALGLSTRIVTNAMWAISQSQTSSVMHRLINAGLKEINITTGTDHIKYVPFDNICRAARNLEQSPLTTIYVIEKDTNTRNIIEQIMGAIASRPLTCKFTIVPKISFTEPKCRQNDVRKSTDLKCDSILSTLVFACNGLVYPCCGLPIRTMPDLAICNLADFLELSKESIHDKLYNFRNVQINIDGPNTIYRRMKRLKILKQYNWIHPCQPCLELYNTTTYFKSNCINSAHYQEVMIKYSIGKMLRAMCE